MSDRASERDNVLPCAWVRWCLKRGKALVRTRLC